jgi:sulfite exporter TauE/SafE
MLHGWEIGTVFLMGLFGTAHCLGMCGGFAVAVAAGAPRPRAVVARQVFYQFGKATSYVFIGTLLVVAGGYVADVGRLEGWQNVLGVAVGALMVLMGIGAAAEVRLGPRLERWWQGSAVCGALGALRQSPSLARAVLIGWVNGFLPCGLSLAALALLAGTGSMVTTAVGAYVFGLGTLPGLLGLALLGRQIPPEKRRRWARWGGVLLAVFGLLTMVRGVPAVHHWFHQITIPVPGAEAEGHSHPHHGHH